DRGPRRSEREHPGEDRRGDPCFRQGAGRSRDGVARGREGCALPGRIADGFRVEGGESEDSSLIAGPPEAEQEFCSWAVHLEEMCSASMIQVTHGRGAALRPRVIRTSVRPAALPRPRVAGTGIGCEL